MKIRFWNAPEVAPELPVKPEVPACLAVLPLATSGATSGTSAAYENELLYLSGSCTGSDTGTTAKPEVPARPAELPLLRERGLLRRPLTEEEERTGSTGPPGGTSGVAGMRQPSNGQIL